MNQKFFRIVFDFAPRLLVQYARELHRRYAAGEGSLSFATAARQCFESALEMDQKSKGIRIDLGALLLDIVELAQPHDASSLLGEARKHLLFAPEVPEAIANLAILAALESDENECRRRLLELGTPDERIASVLVASVALAPFRQRPWYREVASAWRLPSI